MLQTTACSTTSEAAQSCCAPSAARPLCHCLRVYEDEIRQTIDEHQLASVKQVTQSCGAGGGCTACHRHIKRFLREAAEARAAEAGIESACGFA